MTVQCCVCKKVREGERWKYDGWGGRAEASHTYCPRCLKTSVAAMNIERVQADRKQPVGA